MTRKRNDEIRHKYKTKPFIYNLQTYFGSDTISPCYYQKIVTIIMIKSQKY